MQASLGPKLPKSLPVSLPISLPVGVQLWTVRDDWTRDPRATLERLARLGYQGVEFYGDLPESPERLRAWMDELGLRAAAAHVGPSLDFPLDKRVAEAKVLGHDQFVFSFPAEPFADAANPVNGATTPGGQESDPGKPQGAMRALVSAAQNMAETLASRSIRMTLHHHDWEFVSPSRGREYLRSCPKIGLEFDLFWLAVAGLDPVVMVRDFAPRVRLLHAKDGIPMHGVPMTALGAGKVPVIESVLTALACNAPLEWILVELDECAADVWQALDESRRYLSGFTGD